MFASVFWLSSLGTRLQASGFEQVVEDFSRTSWVQDDLWKHIRFAKKKKKSIGNIHPICIGIWKHLFFSG